MEIASEWISSHRKLIQMEHDEEKNEMINLIQETEIKHLKELGFFKNRLKIKKTSTGMFNRIEIVFIHKNLEKLRSSQPNLLPKISFLNNNNKFSEGDNVGLFFINKQQVYLNSKPLLEGVIFKLSEYKIIVQFLEENIDQRLEDVGGLYSTIFQDNIFCLVQLPNDVTFKRHLATLSLMEKIITDASLFHFTTLQLLFGQRKLEEGHPDLVPLPAQKFVSNSEFIDKSLNTEQKNAVNLCLQKNIVSLIHGPPGTGKTKTVCEFILQAALNNKKKILVATPSNIASDNIVERLALHVPGIKMIRLGHPARMIENIQNFSLDFQVKFQMDKNPEVKKIKREIKEDKNLLLQYSNGKVLKSTPGAVYKGIREKEGELKGLKQSIIADLISEANVILATCISSVELKKMILRDKKLKGNENLILQPKYLYDYVVIDECAQSLELSCWVPILLGKQIILAGDHKQLPPTVKSKKAEELGLSITLFDRLMSLANEQKMKNSISVMLKIQYRMNEKIMQIASQTMYDNSLVADASVANHKIADLNDMNKSQMSVSHMICENAVTLMIDTEGCEIGDNTLELKDKNKKLKGEGEEETKKKESKKLNSFLSPSKLNHGESIITSMVYYTLRVNYRLSNSMIGIITPYSAQVDLLKQHLNCKSVQEGIQNQLGNNTNEPIEDVEISTVDGFQGREKEVIIISMVRSNPQKELGFLVEPRRMNVAITRAKRMLIVIGDSTCLNKDQYLSKVVLNLKQTNSVISARDLEFEQKVIQDLYRMGLEFEIKDIFSSGSFLQKHLQENNSHANNGNTQKLNQNNQAASESNPINGGKKKKKKKNNKKVMTNISEDKLNELFKNYNTNSQAVLSQPEDNDVNFYINKYSLEVEKFISDPNLNEMVFDSALTAIERKILHTIAENKKLNHESKGEGEFRCITLSKVQKPQTYQKPILIYQEEEKKNEKLNLPETNQNEKSEALIKIIEKKKKKKKKKKENEIKQTNEELIQQLQIDHEYKLNHCPYGYGEQNKACALNVNLLFVKCPYCDYKYCPQHKDPYVHGCGDAAKQEEEERNKRLLSYQDKTALQPWEIQRIKNKLHKNTTSLAEKRAKKLPQKKK